MGLATKIHYDREPPAFQHEIFLRSATAPYQQCMMVRKLQGRSEFL